MGPMIILLVIVIVMILKSDFSTEEKLVFLKAISTVIKTGMNIVGANTPEKM